MKKAVQPGIRDSSRIRSSESSVSSRLPLGSVSNTARSTHTDKVVITIAKPSTVARARSVERFRNVECRIGDASNPLDVSEYEHIIYRTMVTNERNQASRTYSQSEFTFPQRDYAIDCLSHVHYRLGLTTNGLYRAIGIFDQFCCLGQIPPKSLKLYACACLFIASKIEDIYPARARDISRLGDHCFGDSERTFTNRELFTAETDIINTIGFNTTFATPLFYLTQLMRISGQRQETLLLARYILEIMQSNNKFFTIPASLQASVAVYVTRILKGEQRWNSKLEGYTQYSESQLEGPARWVRDMLVEQDRHETRFMRRKYGSDLFLNVARVKIPANF